MGLLDIIRGWIRKRVLDQSSRTKTFDIIEVRTKELTLTYINLETDIRIENSFFLPITILSIETDIINRDGLKVGTMQYNHPKRLKGRSSEIFTTRSKMSNITAFFNALSHLLAIPVTMRSVGTAKIKFLWMTFSIPVDDTFEVRPTQVRMTEELSAEEKQQRAEQRQQEQAEREQRRADKQKEESKSHKPEAEPEIQTTQEIIEENTMEVELDGKAINKIELEIANDTSANSVSASSVLDDTVKENLKAEEEI